MLPFMKKDKPTHGETEVHTKPSPYCQTYYDMENNLVYVEAAFDPQHLQNVMVPLKEATGSNCIAPLCPTPHGDSQSVHAHALSPQRTEKEFDVFISYAGTDIKYVKQLVSQMKRQQINVWFDQDEVHCGDSHRMKIDQGISRSRYVMIVLSPNYIQKERYWTQAEMNAAIQNESIRQTQLIPLQHHLSSQEIQKYSPMLASRNMIDTSKLTPVQIAKKVRSLLDQDTTLS